MSYVSIHSTTDQVYATSPFHPDLSRAARKIGGEWNGSQWIFDSRDIDKVYSIFKSVYGYTPGAATVDIRVTVAKDEHLAKGKSALFLAGRQIARATGRDSGATISDGVVVIDGDFTSGGSAKNWTTRSTDGIVFELRDVYALAAENIKEMYGWDDDIESVEIIRKDELSDRHAIIECINKLSDEELGAISGDLIAILEQHATRE